jgi:hypothetical protein
MNDLYSQQAYSLTDQGTLYKQQFDRWYASQKKSIQEETLTSGVRTNSIVHESPCWPQNTDSNRINKRQSSRHDRNSSDIVSLGERARKLQEQLHSLTIIEDFPTSQSMVE